MHQLRKFFLLVLAACIVFSVVMAETMIAGDHDCTGAHCPICLIIKTANNSFRLSAIVLFFTGCSMFFIHITGTKTRHTVYSLSPVALKIRFNV